MKGDPAWLPKQGLPHPYYQDAWITLYHGDALEILPKIHAADAVLTDPPYGLNIAYGRAGRRIEGDNDMALLRWVWAESARILSPATWAAVFTDWRGLGTCTAAATAAGLTLVTALVWDKEMLGMGGALRPQYEMIALAAQGEAATAYNGGNVWRVARSSVTPIHPHAKPLTLMRRLVEWFVPTDGLVIDPFAGSGSTLRAAKDCNRRAIGIEIDETYCAVCADALAQETLLLATPTSYTQLALRLEEGDESA